MDNALLKRRIPALDGLRALAIIAVIVCHVNSALARTGVQTDLDQLISSVFAAGWIGVDLFFVLSGFLITGILVDAKGQSGYFRNFYLRRAARIMPLYYGFILLVIVLNQWGLLSEVWVDRRSATLLSTYTYNLWAAVTGRTVFGMDHFWSLGVEEHFYLLWPVVVSCLNRRALTRACLLFATLSLCLRAAVIAFGEPPLLNYRMTPCRFDGLLLGSLVALAWRNPPVWKKLARWSRPAAVSLSGLLVAAAVVQRHFIPNADIDQSPGIIFGGTFVVTVGLTALAYLFAACIVLTIDASPRSRARRLLEFRGLTAIGRYSYATYVFHVLILQLTVRYCAARSTTPLWLTEILTAVWVLAVSQIFAWFSFHLLEKHFLRLGRKLTESPAAYLSGCVRNSSMNDIKPA